MHIGVIGTGKMGSALGGRWAQSGHQVMFGSRTPEKAMRLAHEVGSNAHGGSIAEAADFGTAVLLAVPWTAMPQVLAATGPLAGKTVIDCTNPLTAGDGPDLVIGFTTSAGEELAAMVSQAHVVKAFNAVLYHVIKDRTTFDAQVPTIFYCGEDAGAKGNVRQLIADLGLDPVDAGPLRMARALEALVVVLIQLGYVQGMGTALAFRLLRK